MGQKHPSKMIQAKEGEQFKRIQADGETGGSWVVQNDPSQRCYTTT